MLFCIEKAGFNAKGIYHNMRGHDYSAGRARIDYLVFEAQKRQILTVGIGDGGNEIGMGCVLDAVKKHVRCRLPMRLWKRHSSHNKNGHFVDG